ncbi:unnamed protein product [Spirodela intermedia]|uniref:Aldehyde dehydrogenase n=1 Tax=Spirodela intermedia TaxID=51605 RepID=A0A7I8IS87_SPIIN|nr:unnamed protein product [Spirodela intermedia]CAA6660428.1 unnamed protein product [Spirodela intermedia]
MDGDGERKGEFDGKAAAELVGELRQSFWNGKTRSYDWRTDQLRSLARMLVEKEKDIIDALHEDLGKPEMESFIHEISLAKDGCARTLKELKSWMKPQKVSTSITTFPSSAEIVSEPLGVVLVISAWNYPFLLSLEPVVGAIAAGNAVVLKPSEIAPATSSLLKRLLPGYVDSSSIRVVEGGVPETTALLDQKWDKIIYTGNSKVGRIVMAAAAKHLTPVVLELGGKCPVVVDSKVDLDVATKRIAVGKWGCNNGQACISPDYIITEREFAPKLIEAMKSTLEIFYGKDPMASKDLSRIVNSNHFKRISKLLDSDKVSEKIVHGGQRDEQALKISPTLLLDVPQDSLIMTEEIFGPLLPIITVDDIHQSFDIINSRPKPLAAYLFTKDKKLEEKFVRGVSAGGMSINETVLHITNPGLPFGGVGESGMGAYHGKFSFDTFSHKKAKSRLLKALVNGDIIGIILALIGWPRA